MHPTAKAEKGMEGMNRFQRDEVIMDAFNKAPWIILLCDI